MKITLKTKIKKALEDEGGAAGMSALEKHTKASKKDIEDAVKDMPNVAKHPDEDYILGKGKIKITKEQLESILQEEIEDALDEQEIAEDDDVIEEAGRCTKVTKKASSTRKGKKWMKCVKSDSGGYKTNCLTASVPDFPEHLERDSDMGPITKC